MKKEDEDQGGHLCLWSYSLYDKVAIIANSTLYRSQINGRQQYAELSGLFEPPERLQVVDSLHLDHIVYSGKRYQYVAVSRYSIYFKNMLHTCQMTT